MKIGILTHFYHSRNYGGSLQAYALVTYLRSEGYDAEQISYKMNTDPFMSDISPEPCNDGVSREFFITRLIKRVYHSLYYRLVEKKRENYYWNYREKQIAERFINFEQFQDSIPHSEKKYDSNNVNETGNLYDAIITGSDQVWNFTWFNPAFFLDFSGTCKKIAYAASAGKSQFKEEEEKYLKRTLVELDSISVREADMVENLNTLLNSNDVIQTLDPTMLLTANAWDEIVSPRMVKEPYIFCYFLHNDKSLRETVERCSKKYKLPIVTIPFPDIEYDRYDVTFGKYRMDTTGPADFVSLIKYADYIFTDSFHATVFSLMYHKQFFAFPRGNGKGMESRLLSLTKIYGCEERFCNVEESNRYEYIVHLSEYKYKKEYLEYEELKKKSEEFLSDALKSN